MVNIQRLEQVMQHIKDHPETHDQADWGYIGHCGTTACFAGWTAQLAGAEGLGCIVWYQGRRRWVDILAAELLDIDYLEATERLFYSTLSIADLELAVKDIINEAGSP